MAVMVALLRGVNVGGRNRVAMAHLRQIVEEVGCADVRTYIQSGNVVLRSPASPDAVQDDIRRAVAASTGIEADVVVRTRDELAGVVDGNPFAARAADPAHLHVVFTCEDLPASIDLDLPDYQPEEAVAAGRHIYLHLPSGVGRSPLAVHLGRQSEARGTMRNWRTVTRLLAMAQDLA